MLKDLEPRITVIVSEELNRRITKNIPWGIKSRLIATMLEDLMDLIDQEGEIVLAAILSRQLGVRFIMKELKGGSDGTV